ncbi:Alpha/Beta hydrolase protein [Crucibulum laeve]|uniref:Alpha/Beta hydrolase protein n=1 Tax=Crucibulum laeve TaxID=68775 RepID=A0A5C3LUW2_9AGAR|nr:Alpha/Beta hydrolase protein [Crucibulum laeve]
MSTGTSAKGSATKRRFYTRARSFLLGLLLLYGGIIVLMLTPFIQSRVLYAQHIYLFGNTKFDHPEYYGLAPGKTVNMNLRSLDNTTLGAWFIFSDSYYKSLPYPPPKAQSRNIPSAIHNKPTILFLHGNTGTRALSRRIAVYTAFTARLGANVLAIDYRGFGDSEGHPSVHGVAMDARAGWNYLMSEGARPEDVLIVGHSLGTAIAGLLAAELGKEGIHPRGLVLMSPFSSVRSLMDQYYLFGFLPLLKPISAIPLAPRLVSWSLVHRFDTLDLVPHIKSSVLIVHAEDDWDIPHTHASILFDAFIEPAVPLAPSLPENPLSEEDWKIYAVEKSVRATYRDARISRISVAGFGYLEEAEIDNRKVALLKTLHGGHDIGRVEGVQDVIGRTFSLP